MTGSSGARPSGRSRRRHSRRGPSTKHGEHWGLALLCFSVAGSALAFGAQTPGALVVVALSAAASAFLLRPAFTPKGVWLLFGLACYTLFQRLPLPAAWTRALSPNAWEIHSGAHHLLDLPTPGWVPLSVDPAGTALDALKWSSYACVLLAACGYRLRRGSAALGVLLFFCALTVAVITLAHGIFDIKRIYGLYAPPLPSRWLRGPFVNGNNLAGYLTLGLLAGVGLSVSKRSAIPAWVFGLGLPAIAASITLSDSRAGIAALLLGATLFGLLLLWRRHVAASRIGAGALLLLTGLAVALVLDGSRLLQTFQDRQWQAKVGAWRWSLHLLRDFPLVGVGRGAFESAFEPYRRLLATNWTVIYAYAENFPLQWLCDWGIPVGALALGGATFLVVRVLPHARRDPLSAGLCAGLLALVAQNLVDLGLELFAVMAAALIAAAGLRSNSGDRSEVRPSRRALLAPAAVVVASLLVVASGARPVQLDRQRIAHAYASLTSEHTLTVPQFRAELEHALLHHPGDSYFPLVGSYVEKQPLRWIGRALERGPLDGRAHLRLSELLVARGAVDQALLHLRLSALYDVTLRDGALGRAAGLVKTEQDLRRAFPPNVEGGEFLSNLCGRLQGDLALECWQELAAREDAPEPKRQLARALLSSLSASSPACAEQRRAHCLETVESLLRDLERRPHDFKLVELRARYLAVMGELSRAASLLTEGCPATPEARDCCELAFDLATRSRDLTLLGVATARYASLACTEPDSCAQAHQRIGRAYADLGAWGLALSHFFDAADRAPSPDRWLDAAEAATRSGAESSARIAMERANRAGDLTSEQRRRALAVQNALAASLAGSQGDPGPQ